MPGPLFRQVAEVFEAVSDDDMRALWALDRFEADRIAARRRYEECGDRPVGPGSRTPS